MNELLDEDVISRLRSALDEVSAESDGVVALEAPRPQVSAGRWMAIAAAAVLVVGAVTAIAINRNNAPEVSTAPTDVATTSATEPVLIRTETPWFRLVSADLVPGERTNVQCCVEVQAVAMAWSNGDKYLTLVAFSKVTLPELDPVDGSLVLETDSEFLEFRSVGLSADERATLAGQVVPGSGLPYLLPVEGWAMVAFGQSSDDGGLVQTYTPLNNDPLSSYLPFIEMRVGGYRGELSMLATSPEAQPVTVAGYDGWKVTESDGVVSVFWEADNGYWATLRIDAQLADRADALIAGVIQVTEVEANQPTVETVPVPTAPISELTVAGDALPPFVGTVGDAAIGLPAPSVIGFDYEGNEILINPADGPHLVMFQAHWCPHCARNLPNVMEWMTDGTIPSWLPVTLVSTAESPGPTNYPADKWLQEMGWTGRVLRDSNEGDAVAGAAAVAYGATGWPYFVVIGVDGQILARATGELTRAEMTSLLAGLPEAPRVLGHLEIPAIDSSWFVVDNSLTLAGSARLGPVFLGDTLPSELPIGGTGEGYTMIFGNRTTHGAPFLNLDQLVVGDTFTWTDETGTATFEVWSTDECAGAESCSTIAGSLLLSTSAPLFTDQEALYVFARRTA